MSTSLSNLVNNLSDGVHNDKCTDYKSYLDYMTTKDSSIVIWVFWATFFFLKHKNLQNLT